MIFKDAAYLRVKVITADVAQLLTAFNDKGIRFRDVSGKDEMTVLLTVRSSDIALLRAITEKRGEELLIEGEVGAYQAIKRMGQHGIILVFMAFLMMITIYFPQKILFIDVEGNDMVSKEEILSAAQEHGIYFGGTCREINSEKFKNSILLKFPQLQWAGVSSKGCVVTVSVRERVEEAGSDTAQYAGIEALRDGVIREITVTGGNPLCSIGDVVKEGQMLISPYIDCGRHIQVSPASGEVYAETKHQFTAISPLQYMGREGKRKIMKKYSLKIGKNFINLFKGSGISDAGCVKMYKDYSVTLFDDFVLPLAICVTTEVCYDNQMAIATEDDCGWVQDYAEHYLRDQMIAGTILSEKCHVIIEDNLCYCLTDYACLEMIGRASDEVKVTNDGKRD